MAWILYWAYNYVTAWLGERIAADLRNRTYAHLQGLSLEFFGGKRTGDLITRVSSDTDRICNFLSVSVLDVRQRHAHDRHDGGHPAVLASLAGAGHAGARSRSSSWLVYRVRGRLRRGLSASFRVWAEMTSVLADTIPGIRVVKAFAQESREIERFRAGQRSTCSPPTIASTSCGPSSGRW